MKWLKGHNLVALQSKLPDKRGKPLTQPYGKRRRETCPWGPSCFQSECHGCMAEGQDGTSVSWFSFADRQLAPSPWNRKINIQKHPQIQQALWTLTLPHPTFNVSQPPRPHCVGHRLTLSQEHGRAQEVLEVRMAQAPLRKLQPAEASRWKKPSDRRPHVNFCEAEAIRTMIHGRERFMRYKV